MATSLIDELIKEMKEKNNSNFYFDKLDWEVQIAFKSLCKILNKRQTIKASPGPYSYIRRVLKRDKGVK